MLALATLVVPLLLIVGVAPPAHVAVNVLFVPYVVLLPLFVTSVEPSLICVHPFTLVPLNVYVAVASLH